MSLYQSSHGLCALGGAENVTYSDHSSFWSNKLMPIELLENVNLEGEVQLSGCDMQKDGRVAGGTGGSVSDCWSTRNRFLDV
jgi:hypothetical protein